MGWRNPSSWAMCSWFDKFTERLMASRRRMCWKPRNRYLVPSQRVAGILRPTDPEEETAPA